MSSNSDLNKKPCQAKFYLHGLSAHSPFDAKNYWILPNTFEIKKNTKIFLFHHCIIGSPGSTQVSTFKTWKNVFLTFPEYIIHSCTRHTSGNVAMKCSGPVPSSDTTLQQSTQNYSPDPVLPPGHCVDKPGDCDDELTLFASSPVEPNHCMTDSWGQEAVKKPAIS